MLTEFSGPQPHTPFSDISFILHLGIVNVLEILVADILSFIVRENSKLLGFQKGLTVSDIIPVVLRVFNYSYLSHVFRLSSIQDAVAKKLGC